MRNSIQSLSAGIVLSLVSTAAYAEGISTHVLDIKDGVGRADVPVELYMKDNNDSWTSIGSAMTEENGRVESFGEDITVEEGVYKLTLATAEAIVDRLAKTQIAHSIFNPVAGQGDAKQDLAIIRQLLEPHFSLRIHQTTPEIDAQELVKTAVSANADLVIAAGGDGTVSAVAGGSIGTGIPLGIIPRGTANAFAATLGIPRLQPIRNACQVILAGHSQAIDAAYCNGFPMILLAGIGYEANVVEKADRDLKNRWGSLAYLMSGWKTIDEQQLFEIELESLGKLYQFSAGAITIANAAPSTSVLAQGAGQVLWNDGLLDVTIVTAEDRLEAVTTLLKLFSAAITKTELAEKNVVHGRTQQLKIATNPLQKVVVDGEIIGTTPVEIECIPNSLTVLVSEATVLFTG